MNYYKRHIGDYMRDTAHLSMIEDGAYSRLIDIYYIHEKPLPLDMNLLYRLTRARSEDERQAIDLVLAEFFIKRRNCWQHKRCELELKHAEKITQVNRVNGSKGGRPKKDEPEQEDNITQPVSENNPDGSYARSRPLATSHKPLKSLTTRSKASASRTHTREKVSIPDDFAISEGVRTWANEHHHAELETHLESFRNKCRANDYRYSDWDAAFREAIRSNWAKVGERINGSKVAKMDRCAIDAKQKLFAEEFG